MASVKFGKAPSLTPAPADIPVDATVTPVPDPLTATATSSVGETVAPATTTAGASPAPAVTMTVTPSPGVPAVVPQAQVPATNNPGFHDDQNISASDLKLPRFNIVQKVGELSNNHTHGSIVLDGTLVLAEGPKPNQESAPVRILIVGLQPKKFVEKVAGGERGNFFDTEEQVVAAGGTLDYNEAKASVGTANQKSLYQPLITALILVEKPANVDGSAFPLEIDGKQYALALYSMKGTAYTNAAKHFLTARRMGICKQGFRYGWWTVTSKLKAYSGGNASYIPIVRPQEKSTENLRKELFDLLSF